MHCIYLLRVVYAELNVARGKHLMSSPRITISCAVVFGPVTSCAMAARAGRVVRPLPSTEVVGIPQILVVGMRLWVP